LLVAGRNAAVNFDFDEDQEELRDTVRRFLEHSSAEADVRWLMATDLGYDAAVWAQMAGQLGLHGLAIPEAYGGAGFSFVELGIVLEEMGRVLLCAPFFASAVMAAQLLLATGDEQACKDYLPGIASGETIATVALTESDGQWQESSVTMRAVQAGGTWRLSGTKTYVPDGASSGLILAVARTDAGVGVFAVEGDADGLSRESLPTMDQTRKQARLDFDSVPARRSRPSASPPNRRAGRSGRWRWRSSTPSCASSSAGRSAPSRPSSTSARRCWWRWSR
jgi:alkylation response protein AidB-like acyl-CoA dehydrogenase